MANLLRSTGLPARALTLEITENVIVDNEDRTLAKLTLLRELGIRLAIDDFGTGYSSLSYLHRLPVDILKIDRSYVSGLGTRPELTSLTGTIVRLGRDLGLVLVAEGIEEATQVHELIDLGCDLGQGFLFAQPLCAHDLSQLLRERGLTLSIPKQRPAAALPLRA